MDPSSSSSQRLAVLTAQFGSLSTSSGSDAQHAGAGAYGVLLSRQDTAATTAVRSLPRFDPYILETYLDDLREMKRQVYDLFKFKPELLPGPELSKGACACACGATTTSRSSRGRCHPVASLCAASAACAV